MLLRLRVRLPDRPGSLGQVARTLGVTGADIVQMVVLERVGGRAVDDFTVIWPAAAPMDRILTGLGAIPGVAVEGVWRSAAAPVVGGADAELVGHVAANPSNGIATLVDAIPGLLSADWAAVVAVPVDWAKAAGAPADPVEAAMVLDPADEPVSAGPTVIYASWRAPQPLHPPEVTPLRPRAFDGPGPQRFAAAPFGRAGLVLLAAREAVAEDCPRVPAFHVTEVDRLAQLVRASALVLGSRLDQVASPEPARLDGWPVNRTWARLAAALDT
jgi:hypothetical protein